MKMRKANFGHYKIDSIVILIVFLLFMIIGIYVSFCKDEFLIAGFNTMPGEKAKYDTVGLCKFMGKIMISLCFSMLI